MKILFDITFYQAIYLALLAERSACAAALRKTC